VKKHEMTFERGGMKRAKKKAVKGSKKSSPLARKVRAAKRTAWNVLGGVGMVAVLIWMFQYVAGGR
jgi:hypothetical protein